LLRQNIIFIYSENPTPQRFALHICQFAASIEAMRHESAANANFGAGRESGGRACRRRPSANRPALTQEQERHARELLQQLTGKTNAPPAAAPGNSRAGVVAPPPATLELAPMQPRLPWRQSRSPKSESGSDREPAPPVEKPAPLRRLQFPLQLLKRLLLPLRQQRGRTCQHHSEGWRLSAEQEAKARAASRG